MIKTRERMPEPTRKAVLAAAEDLFSERGFAGTSMRDIAHASGISPPLIHHHFGAKRDLYEAVKLRVMERFLAMWPSDPDAPATGELTDWGLGMAMRILTTFLRKNENVLRLASWTRLEGDTDPWPREVDAMMRVSEFFVQLRKEGGMRSDVDPVLLTVFLEAAALFWFENREWTSKVLHAMGIRTRQEERFFAEVHRILLDGVRAR